MVTLQDRRHPSTCPRSGIIHSSSRRGPIHHSPGMLVARDIPHATLDDPQHTAVKVERTAGTRAPGTVSHFPMTDDQDVTLGARNYVL